MTETDTSRKAVERLIEREPILTSMPPQETDVAKTLRALLARAEKAEVSLSQMRDAVAEIEGFSEGWPTHGNAPLAIVAGYSLHKTGREKAEAERDEADAAGYARGLREAAEIAFEADDCYLARNGILALIAQEGE